jgi:FlaA1/EpsC-like NDP-sugar epimerase
MFVGNFIGSVLFAAVSRAWIGPAMPRSVWIIDALFCFVSTTLVRFSVRIHNEASLWRRSSRERTGILIYGAGAAGANLVREVHSNPSTLYEIKGFLDDDPAKEGALIMGVPVLGSGAHAFSVVHQLNRRKRVVGEIVIAMPSATGPQRRQALANCRAARIPCKIIPSVGELLSGKVLSSHFRKLSVQDLLGREPVKMHEAPVRANIAGRSILVTGAAGSIGSELCRHVARFGPARLVAFDRAESDLFKVENELREKHPGLELVTALGDIREIDRLAEVLYRCEVESIFHAAAYKHVPMMESHVLEAVRNNILGTWNLLGAARRGGVRDLLMISSDKAVNPICVMGATKRVCERIISAWTPCGGVKGVAVRFGNVLGSNGSVVPVFQAQIDAGGPVRVTHPDARRYFMTISEAVSLVVQAWTRSQGSEIFVLDMGEPIRIVDLAENMIRLAGLTPYNDIDIQFSGLRPGEKLIEEINNTSEGASATDCEGIKIIREVPLDWETISGWISQLKVFVDARQEQEIILHIQELVPEYRPAAKWAGGQAQSILRHEVPPFSRSQRPATNDILPERLKPNAHPVKMVRNGTGQSVPDGLERF